MARFGSNGARVRAIARWAFLPLVFWAAGCDGGGGPTLQGIGNQTLQVNEEFRLTIGIDNPTGASVALRIEDPMLPSFDRVTSLSTSPEGGVFLWSPLSSHTGTHELTFVLTDGGGTEYDRESALFEVQASAAAAPVFVRPGAGGTYDLERDPCVTFDVEVRDDDSATVEIGARGELPDRATLANTGDKTATFDWCPTPDQAGSSERWTIGLYASDGEQRVEHDYIIVLRTPPKEGCPGTAPVVTVLQPLMGERVTSGAAFPVEATVTDDMGLRDPPLLYYSTSEPDDLTKPDVTQFQQAVFERASGDTYVARITGLGLEEGEMAQAYFLVSATDNDDEMGATCDHRTDTDVISFFAVGGAPPDGSLMECEFCTHSMECASGVCAATASGGRCVEECSDDGLCESGSCGATPTTEGAVRAGCGPTSTVCGSSGGACTEEEPEIGDSVSSATAYPGSPAEAQICSGDDDVYSVSLAGGDEVVVTVDGFAHLEGDLDLDLRSSDGTILATSASARDAETVSYCNAGSSTATVYARVFGFDGAENAYTFTADVGGGAGCCTDDANEDDDSQSAARSLSFTSDGAGGEQADFAGTVCPGDDDWLAIPMSGPGRIEVLVAFTHADGDIDIALYDPSGVRVARGVSVTDDEELSADVAGGGTYALRVFGFDDGNDYSGLMVTTAGSSCASTADCPDGTVCEGSGCVDDVCTSDAGCPSGHTCPTAGPSGAIRHCAASCEFNSDCRSGHACKWTVDGRACGLTGGGQNGDSCGSYVECGGQRTCLDWPGGYCARAECTRSADCERPGTTCVTVSGRNVCALRCLDADVCRAAEGYDCELLEAIEDDTPFRYVCVPS